MRVSAKFMNTLITSLEITGHQTRADMHLEVSISDLSSNML